MAEVGLAEDPADGVHQGVMQSEVWTKSRVPAAQYCPLLNINSPAMAFAARPRSASGMTMIGDLPPNSRVTRFMLSPAAARIDRPTRVEPVNVILLTSGCSASACPAPVPKPVTILTAPGWKTGLQDQLAQSNGGQRRQFRGLKNDCAAHGKGWCQLVHGHQERRVPGCNRPDNTHRLADHVGHPAGKCRSHRHLTGDLVRPPGDVSQIVDRHGDVNVADRTHRIAAIQALENRDFLG
jgi:hypothetical protein